MSNPHRDLLNQRIAQRSSGLFHVKTELRHFIQINYIFPKERLTGIIPTKRFDILEISLNGRKYALLSVVLFVDHDFYFQICAPLKFTFHQTNYRIYIRDKKSGQHAVWFLGTTLGSPAVYFARNFWKLPWHFASYKMIYNYCEKEKRYLNYSSSIESNWGKANVEVEDTGIGISSSEGFNQEDEWRLVLTHPVQGFFNRLDGQIGTYSIWHPQMNLNEGCGKRFYFEVLARLKLLSREEMNTPHSIFITPQIPFEIHLPPQIVSD